MAFQMMLFLFSLLFPAASVNGQSGFVSIDCGLGKGLDYRHGVTQIYYTSDDGFVETGTNMEISVAYFAQYSQQYRNLRSFPEGGRNCYKLPTTNGSKYLIRAFFVYGNYDGKNQPPAFDLYLGLQKWASLDSQTLDGYWWEEITTVAPGELAWVCLIDTGMGTPFISALELRPLPKTLYDGADESQSLAIWNRYNVGGDRNVRYPDDAHDRLWEKYIFKNGKPINTTSNISSIFELPQAVLKTAARPIDGNGHINFSIASKWSNTKCYIYLYFAELEQFAANQSRVFMIYSNNRLFYLHPVTPRYLAAFSIYSTDPQTGEDKYDVKMNKTSNSTQPPILNALEAYFVVQRSEDETLHNDVDAIMNIKTVFGVKRNWMGDPCLPSGNKWKGLNCSSTPPRIISLDLSSSGLIGEIPSSIANLAFLEYLDLSNNNLTGPLPEFLAKLTSLSYLNVTGNKLTGSVPTTLLERKNDGSLSLSFDGNPELCTSDSCKKMKSKNVAVPVVASVSSLAALCAVSFVL